MSLTGLIVTYLINLLFWLWVVRWGGAEWLEGTFTSGFLIHFFAPRWSADGIKLFGYGTLFISTLYFLAALFYPELRDYF